MPGDTLTVAEVIERAVHGSVSTEDAEGWLTRYLALEPETPAAHELARRALEVLRHSRSTGGGTGGASPREMLAALLEGQRA